MALTLGCAPLLLGKWPDTSRASSREVESLTLLSVSLWCIRFHRGLRL